MIEDIVTVCLTGRCELHHEPSLSGKICAVLTVLERAISVILVLSSLSMAQQPLVGQGLLIIEASRSHSRHTTLGRLPLDE